MSLIETSFVIAAKAPKELAEFYAKVHKVKISQGITADHFLIQVGVGINIHIYKLSDSKKNLKGGRASCLCFQKQPSSKALSIVEKWSIELQKFGAIFIEEVREESFGAEVWLSDPEGNDFLLLVPTN